MNASLTQLALLALRLWIGLNFVFAHGWGKISDPRAFLDNAALEQFPLPTVSGWIAILGEFVGGILLTLGLLTRVAAAWVLLVMLGAALVVHSGDPWQQKELALTYAAIALVFLAHGGGPFSIDAWLARKRKRHNPW
jgi:putative oxidoreductase